jgi:hypothetical protein
MITKEAAVRPFALCGLIADSREHTETPGNSPGRTYILYVHVLGEKEAPNSYQLRVLDYSIV